MPEGVRPDGEYFEGSSAWLLRETVGDLMGTNTSIDEQFAMAIRAWPLSWSLGSST
jgi:hypothetical protein